MLRPFAQHVGTCCELLALVGCCWLMFETRQTFGATSPNISFVLWSPKRSPTLLGPCAQNAQQCWIRAGAFLLFLLRFRMQNAAHLQRSATDSQQCRELLRPFKQNPQHMRTTRNNSQHCWADNVGSCCVRLHGPFT